MGDVNFTNHSLMVRALDTNKDGFMNELQIADHLRPIVDTDTDGRISGKELVSALGAEKVEVNGGRITENRGFNINTPGLETLKNVNIAATNAKTWVWSMPATLSGAQGYNEILHSNREYAGAIRSMRNSLHTIKDQTSGISGSIPNSINSTARNAISTERALNFDNFMIGLLDNGVYNTPSIYDDPYNQDPNRPDPYADAINTQIAINNNLRTAYNVLNNSLETIKDQTSADKLPDMKKAIHTTDRSISDAYLNINTIKNDPRKPSEVKAKMYQLSAEQTAQITGRALPGGLIGGGIGLVAGGVTYAITRDIKTSLMVGGGGLVVGGGIGALIGHNIDKGHEKKASELQQLGDDVERYNPEPGISTLETASVNTYGQLLKARSSRNLDEAQVVTNDVKSIHANVKIVENESARILSAYRK